MNSISKMRTILQSHAFTIGKTEHTENVSCTLSQLREREGEMGHVEEAEDTGLRNTQAENNG